MSDSRFDRMCLFGAVAVVFFLAMTLSGLAHAEDSQDIRGTKHGCADVTATGGWDTLTSSNLENQSGSTVLASGLYWTELLVKDGSATVYVCEAAGASCGAGTGGKMSIAGGAALALPLRGLSVTSVAVYAAVGTTLQVCGYFRTSP